MGIEKWKLGRNRLEDVRCAWSVERLTEVVEGMRDELNGLPDATKRRWARLIIERKSKLEAEEQ